MNEIQHNLTATARSAFLFCLFDIFSWKRFIYGTKFGTEHVESSGLLKYFSFSQISVLYVRQAEEEEETKK